VSGQRVIACGVPVIASWHAIAARYAEFMRREKYERGLGSGERS
jgi:hypothetical protein